MPQAIPIVIAAWSAIGATTIAGIAVGAVIQGAIIGAAIGGITAAITGGNIGKGILFGAVGGAVMGGISGALGGSTGGTAGGGQGMLASAPAYSAGVAPTASGAITASTSGAAASSLPAAVGGGSGLLNGAGSSLINAGGQMLAGSAKEDMAAADRIAMQQESDKNLEATKFANATNRLSVEGQIAQGKATLADARQQFDTGNQLAAEKLARQQSAVTQATAARKGMLSGNTPSIDRQVYDNEKLMVA